MHIFSERIKLLRKQRKLTQVDMAKFLGCTERHYQQIEYGRVNIPTLDLLALADYFDVSVDYLLGKTDEPKVCKSWKIPLYDLPVSAGTGTWLSEGHEYEKIAFDNAPEGTDFALKVCGNSMMPMYADGDIVFIRAQGLVESGQVGVFVLNGEGFLKQLQGNRLVSFNPAYEPIIVGEFDEFFCAGRVIGKQ